MYNMELSRRYLAGETTPELALLTGQSRWAVTKQLKAAGVSLRRAGARSRHRLHEDFFDVIDTEEKAYWLGFLFADGSVRQHAKNCWSLRLNLAVADREHVEKFRTALKSTVLVKISAGAYPYAYLAVYSQPLISQLVLHGCVPNKTGKHGTPSIAENLKAHFYRGYFDGDGSLSFDNRSGQWELSVIASTTFARTMQLWLMSKASVNLTRLGNPANTVSDVKYIRYHGNAQVKRICDVLYRDATVYLNRKFELYQRLVSQPGRAETQSD